MNLEKKNGSRENIIIFMKENTQDLSAPTDIEEKDQN